MTMAMWSPSRCGRYARAAPWCCRNRRRPAVALLPQRLQRRHGAQHAASRQADDRLRALAQLRAQLEDAAVQRDEALHDRQAETGAALRRLVRERALAESLHDAGYLLLG